MFGESAILNFVRRSSGLRCIILTLGPENIEANLKIIIAPNAFKNALSAERAAEAIHQGIVKSGLECECILFPVGDGGDGTGELLIKHLKGERINTEVHDPLGRRIVSSYGLIPNGKTAVIEMASASGLRLLKESERNPLRATSLGTGELIVNALERGVNHIILAVGGSATVDAGMGILYALGYRFLDGRNNSLSYLPESLVNLHAIDSAHVHHRVAGCQFTVLCDVKNSLLGTEGSIPVFAPQKGATREMMNSLEEGFLRFNKITKSQREIDLSDLPHGGAAGGVAAMLYAYMNARLVNGISYFLEITEFENVLNDATLVITGEGSLDEQTLEGKAPYGVAMMSRKHNVSVVAMAGIVDRRDKLSVNFDSIRCINTTPFNRDEAMAHTFSNLLRSAEDLGRELITQQK